MRKKIRGKLVGGADRVVVCVAGASASGKGEATEHLKRKLEGDGGSVYVLNADDYYKGVSRLLADRLAAKVNGLNVGELAKFICSVTGDKNFSEKFSNENIATIADYTGGVANAVLIKEELSLINFDTPESVDLAGLAAVLEALKNGEEVEIPKYSMKLSELAGARKIDGKKYNVILLEGIYALNERILKYADVTAFVEADFKTLFIRRFRRDVLAGRSSWRPEFTLKMILETVLPAYQKYILPIRENADMILINNYTELETFDVGQYDVQDKIPLSETETEILKSQFNEPLVTLFQEDYYFSNEATGFDPEHLIRARVENGRLKSLAHKGIKLKRADGKIIRPSEHFIKKGEFGEQYKDITELISSFKKGGFRIEAQFSKVREVFQSSGVTVALDKIAGLGTFIELSVNNKLSKASGIDEFRRRFGLENRRSVGPYIDEYLAKLDHNPEAMKKTEDLLNAGVTRGLILEDRFCEVLEEDEKIKTAMNVLREGYPHLSLSRQCFGRAFREAADIILNAIAAKTIKQITNKNKIIVLLPWRSGLAFGESYRFVGVDKFYHLSSKRNEKTLETEVDYESGVADKNNIVIIADPMLATGNTIVDAISRIKNKGVSERNIILNAVVAAPTGVARVKKDYPEVKIIVGALDEKLDYKGYIVPGLGDFGDKYFAEISSFELQNLADSFKLDKQGWQKMLKRITKQAVSEVLQLLLERDLKDMEIDHENRIRLEQEGLVPQFPKKIIKIDTGRINGIKNVTNIIIGELAAEDKIISLEGVSGSGKTATADALKEKLDALKFSMGEVFRYLVYCRERAGENNFLRIISRLNYRIEDNELCLFDEAENISVKTADELRLLEIERQLPDVAAQTQRIVIEFIAREISRLREVSDRRIVLEGRAFTLDFIPSDIRVKLIADPSIRADRRWAQQAP